MAFGLAILYFLFCFVLFFCYDIEASGNGIWRGYESNNEFPVSKNPSQWQSLTSLGMYYIQMGLCPKLHNVLVSIGVSVVWF